MQFWLWNWRWWDRDVTECICTLCLCCCMYFVCHSVGVLRVCTSVDLLCMCYVLWFRRHSKWEWEKARGNSNDLSYVPSKRKEEIKSGTSGCGSFVVPYFQPATSTDRLHLYITNTVVHALIKPEKQQGNTSVLVHHGQQEHCNTWKTTGQYFCSCTAQTL